MIATWTAKLAAFAASAWAKIALYAGMAGAFALALLGIYAAIRRSGRDALRADDATVSLDLSRRMQDANASGAHSAGDVDGRLHDHTF